MHSGTPGESEWLDAGLRQMYVVGMWPQRLRVGLAIAALASLAKSLSSRGRGWALHISITGALAALTLLSHPVTG